MLHVRPREVRMRCVTWLALAVAAVGANTSAFASQAEKSKLDAALQGSPVGVVRVIIQTTHGQTSNVAERVRSRARQVLRQFAVVDALTAEVGADDLAALQADAAVTNVSIDAVVASTGVGDSSPGLIVTTLSTLGLPLQGLTGKGVGVAVIDSGLALSGDFSGVIFYDFTSSQASAPYDEYGHGTHVSGLIA